jgi:hypothetical protein
MHALQYNPDEDSFYLVSDGGLNSSEIEEQWVRTLRIPQDLAESASEALQNEAPLPDKVARPLLKHFTRAMSSLLGLVRHGARALRMTGQNDYREALGEWLSKVQTGPSLQWRDGGKAEASATQLRRSRHHAAVAVAHARTTLGDEDGTSLLDEMAAHEDDWVKIAVRTAMAECNRNPETTLERIEELCSAHHGESDYAQVIGLAAIESLTHGLQQAPRWVEFALESSRSLDRAELNWLLSAACQHDEAADMVTRHLSGSPVDSLPEVCMAADLRNSGHSVEQLDIPKVPTEEKRVELRAAHLALRAMSQDSDSASQLLEMLRSGTGTAPYYAALYLGLARVWTATSTLAAVSDRNVSYVLQGVCAGMLARRGYSGSVKWFKKVLKGNQGIEHVFISDQLAQAAEHAGRRMLACRDVNVGRFV